MITRREKLLIRPWEQRKYENHLRKIRSAGPAIDDRPPPYRVHVLHKLKKQQKENERCDKIERDNFILLQRLRKVMSTSRVDNYWTTAQPSFLNRVELYQTKSKPVRESPSVTPVLQEKTRKEKCCACTPKKVKGPMIPEERVPWEPLKPQIARKRSQSLPPRSIERQSSAPVKSKDIPKPPEVEKVKSAPTRMKTTKSTRPHSKKLSASSSTHSITLSRGDVHLSINFPPDTLVKLKEGQTERFLIRGDCQCKAIKAH